MLKTKNIGVIGAGVMGVGVAQNLAQTDHQVVLIDVSDEVLEKAKAEIYKNVRFSRLFNKEISKRESPQKVLDRIIFSVDYEQLHDVDFVVENATEKWAIKEQVYKQLDEICPAPCVFAANTSAISITRIGSATRRPQQVVGMHFMNPVPLKTIDIIGNNSGVLDIVV